MESIMKHILIAEDEAATRLSVSLTLRKAGYQVSGAEDGQHAMGLVRTLKLAGLDNFDLALLDIQMPGWNGLRFIDELRRDHVDLPILVMTAYANDGLEKDLKKKGCNRVLHKPFAPDELLDAVHTFLKE
jgi:CheY-like chemotaxis protein